MRGDVPLFVFGPAGQQYAVRLETVERVVRAVALTPLPGAPHAIRGIFSLHGRIVPVGDFRLRFGLAERPISASDHIVITRSARRVIGLLAAGSIDVLRCSADEIVDPESVIHGADAIEGIVRLANGLVLIQDLARFLSLDEELALDEALDDIARAH